jgi:hypothetical protein
MLFTGTLRSLGPVEFVARWAGFHGVLLKEFGAFAQRLSARVRKHAEEFAAKAGRLFEYVASSRESKLEKAREIAQRDGIQEGLVCVLAAVEPCMTFTVRKDSEKGHLKVVRERRKCVFLYFYFMDREFGLMHLRLQTWVPFSIQICLNGREWLARMMDKEGIEYDRRENCFTHLSDAKRAQELADSMVRFNWVKVFNVMAKRVNPILGRELGTRTYYWTLREAEYATDVMFRDAKALAEVYPRLIEHMVLTCGADDVLRFLGHKPHGAFQGKVETSLKRRPEGVRIRHFIYENSIKMYDKQGSVLRIETTLNNPRRFKILRDVEERGKRTKGWVWMSRSVAQYYRWVEVSRNANVRYLEALASVPEGQPSRNVLDPVSRRCTVAGRRYRALKPVAPEEAEKFASVLRGEFLLNGFRNRDLRAHMFPQATPSPKEERRQAGQVTRFVALLRAHRLLKRVPKSNLYRVTRKGIAVLSTALNLRRCDVNALKNAG